jgi:predicted aldo/keto reductase-like oxidoreductase
VLPKLPRDKLIVQTKVAPQATAKEFISTFNTSMQYLQLEYVDLLTLHGINNRQLLEWSVKKGGCLEAARQLQREGRCRHVGFTTHATTEEIHETIRGGEFDYVNLHWYFVNDLNWSCVEAAAAKDMGVFIISPNDKGGKLYAPPKKLVELCRPFSPMQFNEPAFETLIFSAGDGRQGVSFRAADGRMRAAFYQPLSCPTNQSL